MSITRFHLWKIRNKIRYDFESIPICKKITILKWSLLNHITLLKKSHNKLIDLFDETESNIAGIFNRAMQDHC